MTDTDTNVDIDLANKPLALYNMFPRNYVSEGVSAFRAMATDKELDRVAGMGFNAVYVNPFFAVGDFPKSDQGLIGALYATADMSAANPSLFNGEKGKFFEDGEIQPVGQQVRDFCEKVKAKGMVPMFDLVQSHLSPENAYVEKAEALGIDILKKHPNGNWDIHNLDENYDPKVMNPDEEDEEKRVKFPPEYIWDDAVKFNFEDDLAKDHIIKKILIPYVEEMAELGFRGIRVDSTPEAPRDVHEAVTEAFRRKVAELDAQTGSDLPTLAILAETLNNEKSADAKEVKGVATHCYNSGYFMPNPYEPDPDDPDKVDERNIDTLFNLEVINGHGWFKDLIYKKQNGSQLASMTPVSTHDQERLYTQLEALFKDELPVDDTDEEQAAEGAEQAEDADEEQENGKVSRQEAIERLARIKIAFGAFFTSGGYMMTSGDEYLTEDRPSVFEGKIVPADKASDKAVKRKAYSQAVWQYDKEPEREDVWMEPIDQVNVPKLASPLTPTSRDITDFVRRINKGVQQRKPVDYDSYGNLYFSEKDPDIMCIVTRLETEGDQENTPYEAAVIDVSGKPRNMGISGDILRELEKQSGLSEGWLDSDDVIKVVDTPEQRQAQGAAMGA